MPRLFVLLLVAEEPVAVLEDEAEDLEAVRRRDADPGGPGVALPFLPRAALVCFTAASELSLDWSSVRSLVLADVGSAVDGVLFLLKDDILCLNCPTKLLVDGRRDRDVDDDCEPLLVLGMLHPRDGPPRPLPVSA